MQTDDPAAMLLRMDVDPDGFAAWTMAGFGDRIFGGHTLAHAVVTASRSLDRGHAIDALHAVFVGAGDVTRPVQYRPRVVKQGRSTDVVLVEAVQDSRVILTATATFAAAEPSLAYQDAAPAVPEPGDLPESPPVAHAGGRRVRSPFELRGAPLEEPGLRTATWIKWRGPLPADSATWTSPALVAFAIDFLVTQPGRFALGDQGRSAVGASLDHAMWFHKEAPLEGWLLVVSTCLALENSRSLCIASVFTESRELVCTATQQILLRQPATATSAPS